jgi:RNA-splicing ligase RtcB
MKAYVGADVYIHEAYRPEEKELFANYHRCVNTAKEYEKHNEQPLSHSAFRLFHAGFLFSLLFYHYD